MRSYRENLNKDPENSSLIEELITLILRYVSGTYTSSSQTYTQVGVTSIQQDRSMSHLAICQLHMGYMSSFCLLYQCILQI